jgi:hypothetical protein
MASEPLAGIVQDDLAAYFEHLAARIERLARSLPEEELWSTPFGFGNSVGRLMAHLRWDGQSFIEANHLLTLSIPRATDGLFYRYVPHERSRGTSR